MTEEKPKTATRAFHDVISVLAGLVEEYGAIEAEAANVAAAMLVLEDSAPERRAMVIVVAGELVRSYREAAAQPSAQA